MINVWMGQRPKFYRRPVFKKPRGESTKLPLSTDVGTWPNQRQHVFIVDEIQENAKTRVALRENASVAAALSKAWTILNKNENGHVEREEYVCFLMRIVKFIVPHMKREEARVAAENDWLEDNTPHQRST